MGDILFRDYDRAGLDAQLNLRARWPQHSEYFARWARDSAAIRAELGGRYDQPYGPGPGETLDLFLPPAGESPAPCLIFIHGGYWQSLDKGDFSYLAPAFLAQGTAFASLNYALAPSARIGDMADQVRRACIWLFREAPALGLDPARLVVAGHSAGGHLAAMVLATDWPAQPGGATLPADLIEGACAVSGVYDLLPISLSYHQDILHIDSETIATMSPMTSPPSKDRRLVLAVGSEETAEFQRQQEAFGAVCRAAGVRVEEVPLPARDHFTAIDALGEPEHALFAATLALLRAAGPGGAA